MTPRNSLQMTDAAAEAIVAHCPKVFHTGLRIVIHAGGCSGLQYVFKWGALAEFDESFEHQGARVFVDPKSFIYVRGSVLDYDSDLLVRNFVLRNPNAKASCGCGTSFEV